MIKLTRFSLENSEEIHINKKTQRVKRVLEFIEENLPEKFNVDLIYN